ncbi:MAG: hypothetical protein R3F59_01035 [Myxococcota bacterium]
MLRTWVPAAASGATFGLFGVIDALSGLAPDGRCLHDRLAGTRVGLDARQSVLAAADERPVEVRVGSRFAHQLGIALLCLGLLCALVAVANVVTGAVGWVGLVPTAALGVLGLLHLLLAFVVYDLRPAAIAGAAALSAATALVGVAAAATWGPCWGPGAGHHRRQRRARADARALRPAGAADRRRPQRPG